MIFVATGSSRLGQITPVTPLQTNVFPVAGSVGIVLDWEKSPTRSSAVGTMALLRKVLVVWRRPDQEKKKKVLSRRIGPPIVAPYWLRCSGAVPTCDAQSFALKIVLRTYSKKEPCQELLPDLVKTLMMPLANRPYSAL